MRLYCYTHLLHLAARMKRLFCLIVLLCLFFRASFAQINESDTVRLQLRTALTGNYQTGNVSVLTLRSKLDFAVAALPAVVLKSQNTSLYQAFYKKEADNDFFSRNYVYFHPQQRLYPYVIGYLSTNFRRLVRLRVFSGAGLTWQLLQKPHDVIKISVNLVYEQSRFNGALFNLGKYNGSQKIDLWRFTVYAGGWDYVFHRHLRLYYDAYWQPAIGEHRNYRLQFDAGIDFPIWRGLNVTAFYSYSHEHVVVLPVKQTDNILSFGFNYNVRIAKK